MATPLIQYVAQPNARAQKPEDTCPACGNPHEEGEPLVPYPVTEKEAELVLPIFRNIGAKLRVVFVPEQIPKYLARGVKIENGAAVFSGDFQMFENSKPCFKLWASTEVEVFKEFRYVSVDLDWDPADILSVGWAFNPKDIYWNSKWTAEDFLRVHGHRNGHRQNSQ
ncbi:MAG: hypothetical protein WC444_02030 [Candidatus Paceibacterota bacterium]